MEIVKNYLYVDTKRPAAYSPQKWHLITGVQNMV